MGLYRYLLEHCARPLYLGLVGRYDLLRYEKQVTPLLYAPLEDNLERQRQRLFETLSHAVETVPYYREIAKERNICPSLETVEEDLRKFPLLTKDIIRARFADLKSEKPGKGIFENTSGGSTGEPVTFLQDHRYATENITLLLDGFSGYRFGDKIALLWGSERDINADSGGLEKFLLNVLNRFFYRQFVLNAFRMTENDMHLFVEKINRKRPRHMLAYVSSAYEFARFIEREGLQVHPFKSIITSAGTLHGDARKTIERVFGCPVSNRYGSREVGNMAMECEAHEGLHLNIFTHYLELCNDDLTSVGDGEIGKVVVTALNNTTMPLIRFDIGDRGVQTSHVCSCGRGLPMIATIRGREQEAFKTTSGTLVDGEYFTHLFYDRPFIRLHQVVQLDHTHFNVNLVLNEALPPEQMEAFYREICEKTNLVMGEPCQVAFHLVDEIPPLASGKYLYNISLVK